LNKIYIVWCIFSHDAHLNPPLVYEYFIYFPNSHLYSTLFLWMFAPSNDNTTWYLLLWLSGQISLFTVTTFIYLLRLTV